MNHGLSYCRAVLRGVREFALTKPEWVFLSTYPSPKSVKEVLRNSPDGVIAQIYSPAMNEALAGWTGPLVNISRTVPGLHWPRVGVNETLVGELVAQHLLDQGLKHFAYVGHRGYEFALKREAAFRKALSASGGTSTLDTYETTREMSMITRGRPWTLNRGLSRWLRSLPKPTGIFASNDICASFLSEACRDTGLLVPRDVAIVGVDDDDLLCELARPALSSVAIPGEKIGYETASLLDRLIQGVRPPHRPILLPPVGMVVRESSDMTLVDDPDVAAALRFIRNHAHSPLRVSDVLNAVHISRRRLEQRFRELLQRTPGDEIRRVHLERAKSLLTTTELSLSSVSLKSGFCDAKHLCSAFRQATGETPTQYRRKHRPPIEC